MKCCENCIKKDNCEFPKEVRALAEFCLEYRQPVKK